MTTIAYKGGVIAYDSRATRGELISCDDVEKMRVVDGAHFFISGYVCLEDDFISAWFGADIKNNDENVGAIAYDKDGVWLAGLDESGLFKQKLNYDTAIGSGTAYAITAMDMGASAKQAVKMAAKRDTNTGGKIRTFKMVKVQKDGR